MNELLKMYIKPTKESLDLVEKGEMTKIIQRWRLLGLMVGIRKNSKIEKDVAASYETMAYFAIEHSNDGTYGGNFETWVFPLLRIIRTGKKGVISHISRAVKPNEIVDILNKVSLNDIEKEIVKIYGRKKYDTDLWTLFAFFRSIGQGNIPLTQLDIDIFTMLKEKVVTLNEFLNNRKKSFMFDGDTVSSKVATIKPANDMGALVIVLIASYIIKKINEEDKNKKQ